MSQLVLVLARAARALLPVLPSRSRAPAAPRAMSRRVQFRPGGVARAARPARPARPARAAFTLPARAETPARLAAPRTSPADTKLYRVIRLENGLTALLISDPSKPPQDAQDTSSSEEEASSSEGSDSAESDVSNLSGGSDSAPNKKLDFDDEKLAACAVCVGVGSFSDPPDIQGLAHFVEHMLFMGSEKYPKENDFDSFIKKKGGSDNAATDCEVTTYYLDIQEKYFLQALDKFSQFFVKPLMKKEAMQREREAIESEFAMALPSETNRKDQLISSLFPEGHPARTFTWGNLKSLREMVPDDDYLHKMAHEFRDRHYSAHRMTVAIQARLNLTTLEQYVVDTFGQIPTNNLPPDDFSPYSFKPGHVTPEFHSMYLVKPVTDTTELRLTWCMKSLISLYESKPHEYVSHLLGHEGTGSLLSYLKKKVWALSIYTGNSESGIDYTSMYSLLTAHVVLTQEGLQHVDEVLEAIFSYINMLKKLGPSERIFNEMKDIADISFRFEEEQQPSDYVETLAENMHFYPPEHYITGDQLYYKYDPEGITEILNMLTPDTVNILLLSNKHDPPVQYDAKEEWFNTEYKKKEIPQTWIKKWAEVEPYDSFHLPDENIYIAKDFDIIPIAKEYKEVAEKLNIDLLTSTTKDFQTKEEEIKVILKEKEYEATVRNFRLDQPNLLRKNRAMEVWYRPDFKFRLPTALLYFYFITPLSLKSARESCLLDLWTDVLQQELKEAVYPANMAGLSHWIYTSDKGLTLKTIGYSHNLHLLVDMITREMCSVGDNLTEELFEAVRDIKARAYHNILIKPSKLAKDVRMQLLLTPYVSPRDKAEEIGNITHKELREFSKRFLKQLYVQVMVQGNVPWHEALRVSDKVRKNINWEPLAKDQLPHMAVHQLPPGERTIRINSFNTRNTNTIVTNYYQSGAASHENTAILEVLMMLMDEPLFNRLRTKEQLGYSVFNTMRYTFGVIGYSVTVNTQIDKFSASHVDDRIEAFLKKFARDIKRLPEKALATTKQSLIQLKNTVDLELREVAERNWREIVSQEYVFNRLQIESEAIRQLKLADLKAWFEEHTQTGNKTNYRKLTVQVVGYKTSSSDTSTPAPPTDLKAQLPCKYGLKYIVDETDPSDFINNIQEFKKTLPLYPVNEVNLPEC